MVFSYQHMLYLVCDNNDMFVYFHFQCNIYVLFYHVIQSLDNGLCIEYIWLRVHRYLQYDTWHIFQLVLRVPMSVNEFIYS